jgi:integrase
MATICRRVSEDGVVVFVAQVRRKGARPQSKSFARKTDATAWARSIEAAIEEGRRPLGTKMLSTTVGSIIKRFKEEGEGKDWPNDRKAYLTEWQESIGFLTLADLGRSEIVAERDRLKAKGDLSPASINRRLAALSKVLTVTTREYEVMALNPMIGAGLKLKEPKGRTRYLSADELARLRDACAKSTLRDLSLFVEMALRTGARAGELIGLKWTDVDFGTGVALLVDTKNGSDRLTPVRGILLEALKVKPRYHDTVFNSNGRAYPGGRIVFGPVQYKKAYAAAVKAAGIVDFTFHDLRHTAASYLVQNGVDLYQVQNLLGHTSPAMTMRYAHLSPAAAVNTGDKLAGLLS